MPTLTEPVVGVDVGASTISVGLVCPDGTVLDSAQAPTRDGSVVDTISTLIDRALAQAAERRMEVGGIGLGLPGLVDAEKGYVRPMPGAWIPELSEVPLIRVIGERTGKPVFVDNDVNALTLAEWLFGLGRGASSLVTMAIGTGIGAGLILDGRLVRGHVNAAGEIGHLAVSLTGPSCVCGGVGCLGTYVAGGFVTERVQERLPRYPDSLVLARAGGDPTGVTAEMLFEAARAGDPLACSFVDEACEALAVAIGALVNLLNPEIIVITGGVVASLAPLEPDIMRRVRRRALPLALDATTVRMVPADKRATVRGGAALVLYEAGRSARNP